MPSEVRAQLSELSEAEKGSDAESDTEAPEPDWDEKVESEDEQYKASFSFH